MNKVFYKPNKEKCLKYPNVRIMSEPCIVCDYFRGDFPAGKQYILCAWVPPPTENEIAQKLKEEIIVNKKNFCVTTEVFIRTLMEAVLFLLNREQKK